MCGIFAYVQQDDISDADMEKINKYFYSIKHRGPDHTSTVCLQKHGSTIFLGFHRLAITDPSPETHPLLRDDDVYLVCNGEIYNYKYLIEKYQLPVKTGSDCEVILQLYKCYPDLWPQIIEEFDGVFAFVLYDHKKGILYISRDRIGVRPIFEGYLTGSCEPVGVSNPIQPEYASHFAFASEGKAIPFDTATQFKPGTLTKIELQTDSNHQWKISHQEWIKTGIHFNVPYITAQSIIRDLFTEAVRKRLPADRPIGFLVSGGLDSSLVAAVAHRLLGRKITTFSIGLPGSPDLKAAAIVAKYLDSEHHEVLITTDDIIKAVPYVVCYTETYDITTIRASIPMYLISKYIREQTDIKVVFSGEGADELLGGYLYFHKAPTYKAFQEETVRLMRELYKYDVLRGDRTISAWGLEIRVPFLDADLINFITHLDPAHKMPGKDRVEKAIMRRAFDGYLPDTVLYRQKEAFSDGVGYSSVQSLKDHAEKHMDLDEPYMYSTEKAWPVTEEALLYYDIFQQYYTSRAGMYTEYYWMPQWHDNVTDPSATVLDTHQTNSETCNVSSV